MATSPTRGLSTLRLLGIIAAALVFSLILQTVLLLVTIGALREISATTPNEASKRVESSTPSPKRKPKAKASASSKPVSKASRKPASNGSASVCGLKGAVLKKSRLTRAPKADRWDFQGTAAYPYSKKYGPGATAAQGYKYCYQHSPEGAVFAAAYHAIVSGDPTIQMAHAEYIYAPGPNRERILADLIPASYPRVGNFRVRTLGFRLLQYDGKTATVAIVSYVTIPGKQFEASNTFPLVWVDGDWKVSTSDHDSGEGAEAPGSAPDYIPWRT